MAPTSAHPSAIHLLGIPGEIRNRICYFALSTDSGSVHLLDQRGDFEDAGGHTVNPGYNQLKYTCRQLYNETSDLELKYNEVSFRAKMGPNWSQGLDRLLAILESHPISHKRVSLRIGPLSGSDMDRFDEGSGELTSIHHIRLRYPSVAVIFLLCGPKLPEEPGETWIDSI